MARGLQAKGVRKGDLVAIDLEAEQILDFIVTYSAVHKIGAVAVPMNNRLSPPEVRSILEHAEVTAVVCSGAFEDAVAPLSASLASLAVVATVGPSHGRFADLEDVKSADATAIQVPIDETDLADVMYTSGTTGMPKGVAVRHGNVGLLPNALPRWNGLKWLSATPVFTFAGLGFIYNPMKAGMTVLYLPNSTPGAGSTSSSASGRSSPLSSGHGQAADPPSRFRLGRPVQPEAARSWAAPRWPRTRVRAPAGPSCPGPPC